MESMQLAQKQKIITHSMKDATLLQLDKQEELERQQQRIMQLQSMDAMQVDDALHQELEMQGAQIQDKEREKELYAKPVMDLESKDGKKKIEKIEKYSETKLDTTEQNRAKKQLLDEMYTKAIAEDQIKHGYKHRVVGDDEQHSTEGILELYEKEEKFAKGMLNEEEAQGTIGYAMRQLKIEIASLEKDKQDATVQKAELAKLDQRLHFLNSAYITQRQTKTANVEDVNRARKLEQFSPNAKTKKFSKKLTKNSEFEQKFFANLALYSPNIVVGKLRNEMAEMVITVEEFIPDNVLGNFEQLNEKLEKMGNWVNFFQGKEYDKLPANEKGRIDAFRVIAEKGLELVAAIFESVGLKRVEGKYKKKAAPEKSDELQQKIETLRIEVGEAIASQSSMEIGSLADTLAADNMEKYKIADDATKTSAKFRGLLLIEKSQRDSFAEFEAKYAANKEALEAEEKIASVDLLRKEFDEVLMAQTELINEIEAITLFEGNYRELAKEELEQINRRNEMLLNEAEEKDKEKLAKDKLKEQEDKQKEGENEVKEAVAAKDKEAVIEAANAEEKVEVEGKNHELVRKEIEAVETKIRDGNYINGSITSDEALLSLFARVDKRKKQLAGLKTRASVLIKGLDLLAKGQTVAKLTTSELKVLNQIGLAKEEYAEVQKKGKEKAAKATNLESGLIDKFRVFVTNREDLGADLYKALPANMKILYKFHDEANDARQGMLVAYLSAYKDSLEAQKQGDAQKANEQVNIMEISLFALVEDVLKELNGIDLLSFQKMGNDIKDGAQAEIIERMRIMAEGVTGLLSLAHVIGPQAEDNGYTNNIRRNYLSKGEELSYAYLAAMGEKDKYRRICEAYEAGELDQALEKVLTEEEYNQVAAWAGVFYYDSYTKENFAKSIANLTASLSTIVENIEANSGSLNEKVGELETKKKTLADAKERYEIYREKFEITDGSDNHSNAEIEVLNSLSRHMAALLDQIRPLEHEISELEQVVEGYRHSDEQYRERKAAIELQLAEQKGIDENLRTSSKLKPEHVYAYAKYKMAGAEQQEAATKKKYFKENPAAINSLSAAIQSAGRVEDTEQETAVAKDIAAVEVLQQDEVNRQQLLRAYGQAEIDIVMSEQEYEINKGNEEELVRINSELQKQEKAKDTLQIAIGMVGEQKVTNAKGEKTSVFANMKEVANYQKMIGMNDEEYRSMLLDMTTKSVLSKDASKEERDTAVKKQKQAADKFKTVIKGYYEGIESKFETMIPETAYVVSHIEEFRELYSRALHDERILASFEGIDEKSQEDNQLMAKIRYFGSLSKYVFAVLKKEMSGALVNGIPDFVSGISGIKAELRDNLKVWNAVKGQQ